MVPYSVSVPFDERIIKFNIDVAELHDCHVKFLQFIKDWESAYDSSCRLNSDDVPRVRVDFLQCKSGSKNTMTRYSYETSDSAWWYQYQYHYDDQNAVQLVWSYDREDDSGCEVTSLDLVNKAGYVIYRMTRKSFWHDPVPYDTAYWTQWDAPIYLFDDGSNGMCEVSCDLSDSCTIVDE